MSDKNIDTIIFNWPSGAGGDFLLSIYHIIKYERYKNFSFLPTYISSENRFNAGKYPEPGQYLPGDRIEHRGLAPNKNPDNLFNPQLESMRYGYIIHAHDISPAMLGAIPDNIVLVNIDDEMYDVAIAMLYFIKTRYTTVYDKKKENFLKFTPSMHLKSHYAHRGNKFKNFLWSDIFINPKREVVLELYQSLGGTDVSPYIDKLLRIFKMYGRINRHILDNITISELWDMANDIATSVIKRPFKTIDELHDLVYAEYVRRGIRGEL